jgi:hypothetical protein
MRTLGKLFLVVAAVALLCSPALAQRRPGGGGLADMLGNKKLKEELKLTDEQAEKAVKVAKDVAEKHKDDLKDVDFMTEEGRKKAGEVRAAVTEETMKGLKDVLDAKQTTRLNQLLFQQRMAFRGPDIFTDPKVQETLKLSDEQKDKIKTLATDFNKERRELFQGGFNEETRKKMEALRKDTMEKVDAVLKDDQKKALKEMSGEPFEFPMGGGRRPRQPQRDNSK